MADSSDTKGVRGFASYCDTMRQAEALTISAMEHRDNKEFYRGMCNYRSDVSRSRDADDDEFWVRTFDESQAGYELGLYEMDIDRMRGMRALQEEREDLVDRLEYGYRCNKPDTIRTERSLALLDEAIGAEQKRVEYAMRWGNMVWGQSEAEMKYRRYLAECRAVSDQEAYERDMNRIRHVGSLPLNQPVGQEMEDGFKWDAGHYYTAVEEMEGAIRRAQEMVDCGFNRIIAGLTPEGDFELYERAMKEAELKRRTHEFTTHILNNMTVEQKAFFTNFTRALWPHLYEDLPPLENVPSDLPPLEDAPFEDWLALIAKQRGLTL